VSAYVAARDTISAEAGARARAELGLPPDWKTNEQAGTCITPQQIESEMCWVTDT
jgi:hypothetical protein